MTGGLQRFLRRYRLALAIPLVFGALWVALWSAPPTNLVLRTFLLYPHLIVSLPDAPLNLLGAKPIVETVRFPASDGGLLEADLYRPAGEGRHSAVLIVIGAAPRARYDPRAVRLAEGVARMGYVAMLPVLPHLSRKILTPDDTEVVIDSFRYLQRQPFVEPQRVAVLGFSVGQGLAFAAAADPSIRDDVRVLASFGGYYDIEDVITSITTRTIDVDGQRRPWSVDPWAEEVLRTSLIYLVPQESERRLLVAALDGDGGVAVEDLSPTTRLVFAVLSNDDPVRAPQLLAQAPPPLATVLRQLSPRTYLDQIRAEVFIIGSRGDDLIPFTQSHLLRDSLQGRGLQLHYAEFDFLNHVEFSGPTNPLSFLADLVKLVFYSWLLMLCLF